MAKKLTSNPQYDSVTEFRLDVETTTKVVKTQPTTMHHPRPTIDFSVLGLCEAEGSKLHRKNGCHLVECQNWQAAGVNPVCSCGKSGWTSCCGVTRCYSHAMEHEKGPADAE